MTCDFHGQKIARVVVKVGSSLLIRNGKVDRVWMRNFVKQVVALRQRGLEVVVVSSGAIGYGAQLLNKDRAQLTLPEHQAAAAVGQAHLMRAYDYTFRRYGVISAQILFTRENFDQRLRYWHASNTLSTLLKEGTVPIVNENDTVSVDEIRVGDNDTLAALMTHLTRANLLVVLTEVDGLYDYDLNEKIDIVPDINQKVLNLIRPEKTSLGTGGMGTKVAAAKMVTQSGESAVIAGGRIPNVLDRLFKSETVGTYFPPNLRRMSSKKIWIAFAGASRGRIYVDKGASESLKKKGSSLLSSGVLSVEGDFEPGDLIDVLVGKNLVARGLTNFSAGNIDKIKGFKASEIKKILGKKTYEEVVNRDNLALVS
ncbi:glutamate 5-kinase [PVC group bacterium (ex Bugula neritina AB1)]|nr:glutamate 5-kinase [PVC group bacterium (ex Bugula neritina AB1)]